MTFAVKAAAMLPAWRFVMLLLLMLRMCREAAKKLVGSYSTMELPFGT